MTPAGGFDDRGDRGGDRRCRLLAPQILEPPRAHP
jgi:hypothetical protein